MRVVMTLALALFIPSQSWSFVTSSVGCFRDSSVPIAGFAARLSFRTPGHCRGQCENRVLRDSSISLSQSALMSLEVPSENTVLSLDPPLSAPAQKAGEELGDGKPEVKKLEARLMKKMRQASLDYNMIQPGDHIMVCVSGGKDSATLLWLLLQLQRRLQRQVDFKITAVHLDQHQPGYDGAPLEKWLQELGCVYKIVSEDTYSVVKEKTQEGKAYCSMCSRLRRGILYTCAEDIGASKLALGHHGDDAIETLFLNMVHQGQMKGMPARYFSSSRDKHVLRPLIYCEEEDIAAFASGMAFPILPCTLCGSQPDMQRGKMKMLVSTLPSLSPNARQNIISSMADVRPSHLLDRGLREACGMDDITGAVRDVRALKLKGWSRSDGAGKDQASEERASSAQGPHRDPTSMVEDEDDPLLAL